MKKLKSREQTWKKIFLFLVAFVIILIGVMVGFLYLILNDEPPYFIPLNNSQGQYKITKSCPQGQGNNENFHDKGDGYCVEYKGPGVFRSDQNGNFFRVTIGKSRINLAPYVGKRVKNIKGKYVSSSKQCIQDRCISIGGPFVVLNIDSLEAVANSSRSTINEEHSGEGVIEFANIEQGSSAQSVGITGVGSFAVTDQTKIYDENNKQVEFSYLRKGQKVSVSGAPGDGNLTALKIKVQN